MSPDEIFAAQMWPWPDPIIKRDSMGRVLFINAAFLQLYGGSVEDWRGNVVTGWQVPQAPGVPYRFETRLENEAGDSVFDWIEYSLADGTALAIARNVTALLPSSSPPPTEEALVEETFEAPQAPVIDPVADLQAALAPEMPAAEPVAETAPVAETVQAEAPQQSVAAEPVQEAAPEQPAATDVPAEITPVFESSPQESQAETVTAEQPPAPAEATPEPAAEAAPVQESADEPEQANVTERRALPIENGDTVLGNNWRDAVIAKAVGAETTAEEDVAIETEDESDEPAAAPSVSGDDGPLRILLAEDNAINALLTRTLLEAEGHVVDVVEDGALAVEAAKAQHYDLVFMDMRMPNMDGLESTRKIRALDNRSKSLPIIALTANAFDDDRNACFDSGMNDFMTKPVSAEELSEMVRTWTKARDQRMAS